MLEVVSVGVDSGRGGSVAKFSMRHGASDGQQRHRWSVASMEFTVEAALFRGQRDMTADGALARAMPSGDVVFVLVSQAGSTNFGGDRYVYDCVHELCCFRFRLAHVLHPTMDGVAASWTGRVVGKSEG